MEHLLEQRLYTYLVDHCPDVLIRLQETRSLTSYIQQKVAGISPALDDLLLGESHPEDVEAQCMDLLTEDLRPSKYEYLKGILEQDFEKQFEQFRESGTLTYEITGMIQHCTDVFKHFNFCEQTVDNRMLAYAVIERIADYLRMIS